MHRRQFCIFCAAILVSFPGFSAGAALGGLKVCVLPLADLTPSGDASAYAAIIADDLRLELDQEGVQMVPAETVRQALARNSVSARDLLEPKTAAAAARSAGGDVALGGYIALQDDRLQVSLMAYDVETGILVAGLLQSYDFDISLYSRLWQDLLGMLSRALEVPASASRALPDAGAQAAGKTALTLTSRQEGMEILTTGGKTLGRIVGGRLTLVVDPDAAPASLVVEKRLDGYHSERQVVKGAGTVELSPLARASRFGVETDWTTGELLGLGAAFRVYVLPDTLFVSPLVYVSGQPPAGSGGNAVFHVDGGLLVGLYLLFPPESVFRLGVAAGAGAFFSWVQSTNLPVFFDPYVDIASLWIETQLPWFSLALRSDLKYTLGGPTPNLLGQGLVLWGGIFPPVSLGVVFRW